MAAPAATGAFAPRPAAPWAGVRDCIDYGPSSPQMTIEQFTGTAMPPEAEQYVGVLSTERELSEHCLVLNVWTPAPSGTERRPVLVWLHGGGMSTGSASWPLYDFTNLARNNDVVVVGINHRLGIFGFLDLSDYGDRYADSGNIGMLDVVAALRWVRDNIAGFGGDPHNVTIFGESGGGSKVTTLLAMPDARGLFHKAFAMSGTLLRAKSHDAAAATARLVLDRCGVGRDTVPLSALDMHALIDAEAALPAGKRLLKQTSFGPVIGPSLPRDPFDSIAAGASATVPTVAGCTSHEMLPFVAAPDLWTIDDAGVHERLSRLLGANATRILDGYRTLRPTESPASLYILITSDLMMRIPHQRLAEAASAAGGPIYNYIFNWGTPSADGALRAGHGSDMAFCFDNIDRAPLYGGPHAAPLVQAMSGALIALARHGDPNHASLPHWPSFSTVDRPTMMLDVDSAVTHDPWPEERAIWDGVDLAQLGPAY